jgi:RNA ligase
MHYLFPKIRHISDVLPYVEGRDEFVVAERDFGTVINYVVSMADTFDMTGPDDVAGAMRRECRGLKFASNGEIAARPLHKFHNVGEREETQPHRVDLLQPHTIMEKLDGSMIHPMMINGYIRWMTKMGITEVAMQAESFIAKNTRYKDFAAWCISEQLTPVFEWCSPFNQIVLPYEEDQLTLLAVRHNITGEYLSIGS